MFLGHEILISSLAQWSLGPTDREKLLRLLFCSFGKGWEIIVQPPGIQGSCNVNAFLVY
jgi:hypothetical protein